MLAELELTSESSTSGPVTACRRPCDGACGPRWGHPLRRHRVRLDVTCVDDIAALLPTLVRIRPQIWGTVPRILEKITAGLQTKFAAENDPKKRRGEWALEIARQ